LVTTPLIAAQKLACWPEFADNKGRRIIIGTASNFKNLQDQGAHDWGGPVRIADLNISFSDELSASHIQSTT
jgi:hypothetical protein